MRLVASLLLVFATPAAAERYVVQPGETLEHVADAFGCSTAELLRANKLTNTLVPARTIVTIPTCSKRVRTATRTATRSPASAPNRPAEANAPADAKARAALATIDGTPGHQPAVAREPVHREPVRREPAVGPQLPKGEGYHLRRPDNAFGAPHVITYVRGAIAEVRALYADVHVLAIGDLSSQHGGKLDRHLSHQSGVDIDIGFYFRTQPASYPAQFVEANGELDLEATWALLVALSRSTDRDDGVTMMFLDYDLQARLVRFATANGTPKADLEHLFQYPRGKDAMVGLIRHWPSHADHVHVRFAKKS